MEKPITNSTTDASEVIRRLRAVTRRIEKFFDDRAESLQLAMSEYSDTQSAFDVTQRRSAALNEEQRQWEMEKQAEIARLTRASEELAIAWQQLEQRERELTLAESASTHRSRAFANQAMPGHELSPAVGSQSGDETLDVLEMQQLQMQINQHSKHQR
ncbi:MAG: hypothetical protein ACR2NP_14990 [Pirellulaceae bacterium]